MPRVVNYPAVMQFTYQRPRVRFFYSKLMSNDNFCGKFGYDAVLKFCLGKKLKGTFRKLAIKKRSVVKNSNKKGIILGRYPNLFFLKGAGDLKFIVNFF